MMLGEQSDSADYWKKCGDEALANGIKGVVMMGAHWDATGDAIEVAMNPSPGKSPVAYVHPSKYVDYKLEPDLSNGERCMSMLKDGGFNVKPNPKFEWIHDTYLILIRMFPAKCPPTTILSMNARFDPHFHMRVGNTLRSLRNDGYLIIGTGGAVHNLYRNRWAPMLKYRDNFAQETAPEGWALEFRQSVEDCFTQCRGPALRRAITRLMQHPQYRVSQFTGSTLHSGDQRIKADLVVRYVSKAERPLLEPCHILTDLVPDTCRTPMPLMTTSCQHVSSPVPRATGKTRWRRRVGWVLRPGSSRIWYVCYFGCWTAVVV